MREAARALDDVSDHLGEVLRHADELLVEWSQFGAQVRAQVERQVAAIGDVVDDAVARAASAGIDRAVADRLRALTAELERLEQRARAASRAVVEQRERDRRVLWILVAGVVLANALLVAVLLRKPDVVPVAEPIRLESTVAPPAPPAEPPQAVPAAGSAEPASAGSAAHAAAPDAPLVPGAGSNAGSASPSAGSNTGSNATGTKAGSSAAPAGPQKPTGGAQGSAAKPQSDVAAPPRLTPSPIALPPKAGSPRGHKKLP
jgi:hypothetical protein